MALHRTKPHAKHNGAHSASGCVRPWHKHMHRFCGACTEAAGEEGSVESMEKAASNALISGVGSSVRGCARSSASAKALLTEAGVIRMGFLVSSLRGTGLGGKREAIKASVMAWACDDVPINSWRYARRAFGDL